MHAVIIKLIYLTMIIIVQSFWRKEIKIEKNLFKNY